MIKKLLKWEHLFYIFIIIIIVLFLSSPFLSINNSKRSWDWRNSDTPGYHFIDQYIVENNSWPLWDYMTFSGRPLFSFGMPLQYPIAILLAIFFNPYQTLNLMVILHLLLAGISMYFLAHLILKNKKSALISSIIYSLSPYLVTNCLNHPFWVYGLSYIPLELFLAIKAFKSKKFVLYSVLLGIIAGLHFLSGGILQWYYSIMFISFFLFFKIFGTNWKSKLMKSVIILFIFLFITVSLSAIRLLPGNEWISFTNRGAGLSVEEIKRVGHLEWDNFIDTFVVTVDKESKAGTSKFGQISLVGLGLMIFGIYSYFKTKDYKLKKKTIILFLLLSMFAFSIFASGMFLKYIYHIPGIKSQRGIDRSLIIYVVCASIIAGLGMNYIFLKLKQKNISKKIINLIFIGISFLLILNLFIVSWGAFSEFSKSFEHYSITESNPLFLKMAEDKDIFRFHVLEVQGVDWNNFLGASIPLKLESVYGMYSPIWDMRYFNMFLGSTFRSPAKLWGMLNVKYLVSSKEINDTDYELVEKFEDVPLNTISNKNYDEVAFLYKNKKVLPRAFFTSNVILAVGQKDYATQLMYGLLVTESFDPSTTMIINGKGTIDDYSVSELNKYDGVFLTQGSISQNSNFILESYKNKGGNILPDVLIGKNELSNQDLENFFLTLDKKQYDSNKVEIISYYDETPNIMKLKVDNNRSQFLFVSEKYTLYPGWTSKIDGKETEILLANGVLSAIYVPAESKEIIFEYNPNSFQKGKLITYFSILLILIYFGYKIYQKKKYLIF